MTKQKNIAMCDILRQNIAYHDNINNLEAFGIALGIVCPPIDHK